MKLKFILFLPFLLVAQTLSAQTFNRAMGASFEHVRWSSIAFADVDGENDQDVLITGYSSSDDPISKLYTNDGQGNFTKVPETPFEGIYQGSIAFADVDGDNDQDVLITGYDGLDGIAKLYINDGQGSFTEAANMPFEAVTRSSIAFADVDGDNDQDVLITGRNSSLDPISKLYTNDGQGNFTEASGTPFEDFDQSSIAFADVDGDNDQDVLISGDTSFSSSNTTSILYINDGQGNFSEVTGTPFMGTSQGSIAFADVDGDSDQDVLQSGVLSSILYTNDGQGNFTEDTSNTFPGVDESSIAFADVDGDNDQDILISGDSDYHAPIAQLYTNDGQGNFTKVSGTPFEAVFRSSIAFTDVDGDNDQDVLITGQDSTGSPVSKLYINDGQGSFSEATSTGASVEPTDFALYPNPTQNQIHIEVQTSANPQQYTLHTITGQRAKSGQLTGRGTHTLDVSDLAPGMYLLEVRTEEAVQTRKVVVE